MTDKRKEWRQMFTPTQHENIDDLIQAEINKGVPAGPFCTRVDEPIPRFHKAQSERVFSSWNNSFVVLGRDRFGSLASGAGGEGHTQSGMIDLVVGRHALTSNHFINKGQGPIDHTENHPHGLNPNFATDAARIYITQKSLNIDRYFGIDNKHELKKDGQPAVNLLSAVAMKADQIRIIGRDNVRIFAGKAHNIHGFPKNLETNTMGHPLRKPKIELVCDDDKQLEPAVKGIKLVKYLGKLERQLGDIADDTKLIMENLLHLNSAVLAITGQARLAGMIKENIVKYIDQFIATINSELRTIHTLDGFKPMKGGGSILSDTVFLT